MIITLGKSGSVNYLTSKYSTDTACIQAALNAAKSGDTIQISSGKYNITKQVSQQNKDLSIIGVGNVTFDIKTGVAGQQAVYFSGKIIKAVSLASDASKGKTQIVLSNASNLQKSDLIQIWKNVKWCPKDYPDQKTGEMYLIENVSGNTVTLNQPLIRSYKKSESSTARIYRPIRIQIGNIKFQNQNSKGDLEGLGLRYCKDSSISNCSFDDNGQASIRLFTCYNVEVKNSSISDSCRSGRGYGVSIADATAYVNIHDNKLSNCRHCIMSGTGNFEALNRNIIITNNSFIGSSVPDANVIDAHPMTIDYTVTKNTVYPKPGFYAFYDGALESTFSDNKVYGGGGVKRRGSVNFGKHIIKNNYVEGGNLYQSTGSGAGESLIITGNSNTKGINGVALGNENFKKVNIESNTFNSMSGNGIYIVQPAVSNEMNVFIYKNKIENIKNNGMILKRSASNTKLNLDVSGNAIKNVNQASGTYNGIFLVDTIKANIYKNTITGTMYKSIREYGNYANMNNIHDNIVSRGINSIQTVGKNTISKNNIAPTA